MLTIELSAHPDRVRNIAQAKGQKVIGHGAVICELARKLVSAGHNPETLVSVIRHGIDAFAPERLGAWAARTVSEGATGTKMIAWRAHPEHGDTALCAKLEPYRPKARKK
jgi:hypothetical protein